MQSGQHELMLVLQKPDILFEPNLFRSFAVLILALLHLLKFGAEDLIIARTAFGFVYLLKNHYT